MAMQGVEKLLSEARDKDYSAIVFSIGSAGFNAQNQQCPNFIRALPTSDDKSVLVINIDPNLEESTIGPLKSQHPQIQFEETKEWFSPEADVYTEVLKAISTHVKSSHIPVIVGDYVDKQMPDLFVELGRYCSDEIENNKLMFIKGYASQSPVFILDQTFLSNLSAHVDQKSQMLHVANIFFAYYFGRDPMGNRIKPEDFENTVAECKSEYETDNKIEVDMPSKYFQNIANITAEDVNLVNLERPKSRPD